MRRTFIIGAAVALLLALIGGTAWAATADHDRTRTIRLDVEFSPFFLADIGDQGPSLGDATIFSDKLLRNGRQVGQEGGSCTIVDVTQGSVNCVGTVKLRDGQLTFQGLTTAAPTKELVVTGGTGAYLGAEGSATLVENPDQTGTLTLRLRR
jgi:hypothetical protein